MSRARPAQAVDTAASIRQIVAAVEPSLRAAVLSGQATSAEGVLAHLEVTDRDFHSYDLVELIHSRLEERLGPALDNAIEELSLEGDGHDAVAGLTERFLSSQEFTRASSELFDDLHTAVDKILSADETSPRPLDTPQSLRQLSPRDVDLDQSFSGELPSGYHHYLTTEKFNDLAKKLSAKEPLKVRQEAIRVLTRFSSSDLVTHDCWSEMLMLLFRLMSEEDDTLWENSIQVLMDCFYACKNVIMCDVYELLAEHLQKAFRQATAMSSYDTTMRRLRELRVLNECQTEISTYWIRFPASRVESVINKTISLLTTATNDGVPVLQAYALLDLEATWFRKWMYMQRSRSLLLDSIQRFGLFHGCIEVCLKWCDNFNMADQQELTASRGSGVLQELGYSHKQLDYAGFVQSVCMLSSIVLYKGGRALFNEKNGGKVVSVEDLLERLVEVIFLPTAADLKNSGSADSSCHVVDLIGQLIIRLAGGNSACHQVLCSQKLMEVFLRPLQSFLGNSKVTASYSERAMMYSADMLAMLATSENGRQFLLGNGEPSLEPSNSRKRLPAHIIAEFATTALSSYVRSEDISSIKLLPAGKAVSLAVTGGFLFVCRQLYHTGEGLLALTDYKLHEWVAEAWKKTRLFLDEATPRASPTMQDYSASDPGMSLWADTLLDNLLNFAGTPKGVLLLHQTGTLENCVAYMFQRYTQKRQVSKCEKFGYGVMVSQLAITAPGMLSLLRTGFVSAVINDLWSVLTNDSDDQQLTLAISDPLDPMDRAVHKVAFRLLSLLGSFPALRELLHRRNKAAKEERAATASRVHLPGVEQCYIHPQSTVEELLSVSLGREQSTIIYHYPKLHLCTLRLMACICTCLDSFLLLEARFQLRKILLNQQQECLLPNNRGYIIDESSIERNRILVTTAMIGGPSERILPSRQLSTNPEDSTAYPWTMFSEDELPLEYKITIQPAIRQQPAGKTPFQPEPFGATPSQDWLSKCRTAFLSAVEGKSFLIEPQDMPRLLEFLVKALTTEKSQLVYDPISNFSFEEAPEGSLAACSEIGVSLIVTYGRRLCLLANEALSKASLQRLLSKLCHCSSIESIEHQEGNAFGLAGGQKSQVDDFGGFDWFASTVFLICHGDASRAWFLLCALSRHLISRYLWPQRMNYTMKRPQSSSSSAPSSPIHPIYSATAQNVEMFVQAELPLVCSAFRMSGCTPALICQHWTWQCFLNYLDWTELCEYILICLLMGSDFQAYFSVAVLSHLQSNILLHTQKQRLLLHLMENPIKDFHLNTFTLTFMMSLRRKYSSRTLDDMTQI